MDLKNDPQLIKENREILQEIWGSDRTIKQIVKYDPESMDNTVQAEAVILFNRLVYEEQIDDLTEMINYMMISLQALNKIRYR